jgi:hypothetical protein
MRTQHFLLIGIAIVSIALLVSCGPVCTGEAVAPILLSPADKAVIPSTSITLKMDYPQECSPQGYYVKLASDPLFSNIVFFADGSSPLPSHNVTGLKDCTTYYWNVAAKVNGIKGPFSPTYAFTVDVHGTCWQSCDPANLVAPSLLHPVAWEVVNTLNPTLGWLYPDAACDPDSYQVTLEKGPLYSTNMGTDTGRHNTFWTVPFLLEPHSEYRWKVAAQTGSTTGPTYQNKHFFTGPICSAQQLQTPELVEPADGAVMTNNQIVLYIDYPGDCLPPGARIDLATDPGFVNNTVIIQSEPIMDWYLQPLQDCTKYYWRAASVSGSTLSPYTGTSSFSTDFSGTCSSQLTVLKSSFYCSEDQNIFMVDLHFDHAMTGDYEVRFLDSVYPCILSKSDAQKLTCYGPRVNSDLEVNLKLWDLGINQIVGSLESKTPDCSVEFITEDCQRFDENECSQHNDTCYWGDSHDVSGRPIKICKNK